MILNTKIPAPLNILIIEDNPLDQRMLESMIQEENKSAKIQITNSLKETIQYLSKESFDVAILDLNLPDSKGENTLVKISELKPELAIVVNTGVYEDDLGLKTLANGAQDFLIKGKYNAYWLNKVLNYAIERKRYELELKSTYTQLKDAQFQLIQAEKMKVIGGLASGVAHEVRNPLSTILYGVTYINKHIKIEDKNCTLALESIKEATLQANKIISDLLDFASINKLNRQWYDLNQVIDKAVNILKHQLERFYVQIKRKSEANISQVNVDSNRIEQCIINLILNACYAMPKGGIITISLRQMNVTKSFLKENSLNEEDFPLQSKLIIIDIDDAGTGIPNDKMTSVFDPFFTTRRAKGGVGLGLFVCRNIMEIHGGKIILQNKPDKGVRARLIFTV